MDPRERADAMLARARARRGYVVTPEDATSPMDAMNTQQIPRAVIDAVDGGDEQEVTRSIPGPVWRRRAAYRRQPAPAEQDTDRADPPTGPIPALAAETSTTSLHPVNQQQNGAWPAPQPTKEPPEQPRPRRMDGLIPTIQEQPPAPRRSLSQRLDGEHD